MKVRSLLFIDFDGVVNHNDWWLSGVALAMPQMPGRAVEPEPAAALNLLSAIATEIWITSSWARWMYLHRLTKEAFCEMLFAHGLILHHDKIRHFNKAAAEPSHRAAAIREALALYRLNGDPFSLAIVDDCDMEPHLAEYKQRFLRIDSRFMLRRHDTRLLTEWLQKEFVPHPGA